MPDSAFKEEDDEEEEEGNYILLTTMIKRLADDFIGDDMEMIEDDGDDLQMPVCFDCKLCSLIALHRDPRILSRLKSFEPHRLELLLFCIVIWWVEP